jgi:hypothetical protein
MVHEHDGLGPVKRYRKTEISLTFQKPRSVKSKIEATSVTVSDSYVLATTYKSTDSILSHCKTVLEIVIVYRGVHHTFPAILRNSSIGCGGLQCTETAILPLPFRHSLNALVA